MKRFILLFALPLLSACGVYSPLTAPASQMTGIAPVNEVSQTKSFSLSSAIDSMVVTAQGSRMDPPLSEDPKMEAQLVAAMKKHGVDIRQIVSQALQDSLKTRPALQPKPGVTANVRMALSVDAFGTSTFFTSYGPNLGLQAQLLDSKDESIWKNYKFVTHRNQAMPHFKFDELINNPDALRTTFTAAANFIIKELLDSLETELKATPGSTAVPFPEAAPAVVPVVNANPVPVPPSAPANTAPVQPVVKPAQAAKPAPVTEPKEESCNGWCVPGGKIKLFD